MLLAILATIVITFLLSEGVGYAIHRLAHWHGSGRLFRNHLHHHSHAYPPSRFQADRYLGDLRTSFLPVFVPLFVLLNVVAWVVLPWPLASVFFVVSSAVALANNYLHDSFHVEGHWLRRFGWYRKLEEYHRVHHESVKRNLGIYWYGLDRLFGSFRKPSAVRSRP